MNDHFEAHTAAMGARLAQLADDLAHPDADSLRVAREALTELAVSLEELRVTGEQIESEIEAARDRGLTGRARELSYRTVFDQAPGAYLVTDNSGLIQRANRAACELLGREDRFLRGKPIAVLATGDPADLFEVMNRVRERNGPLRIDLDLQTPRGQLRRLTALVAPERSTDDGAGLGWFLDDRSTIRPFEELTPSEAALRITTVQFEGILATTTDAIVSVNRDQRIILYNEAAERLLGWTADEVMGLPLVKILPDRVASTHGTSVNAFAKGEIDTRVMAPRPIEIERKDGSTIPVEATISRATFDHSWISTVIMRDRTEPERLAEELRFAQEFDRKVLQTIGALVAVLDPEGGILVFNRACERVTGFRSEDMVGRSIWDVLVPEDQQEELRGCCEKLLEAGGPVTHENDWLTADGDRRSIQWSNSTIADLEGNVTHIVAAGMDATRQLELEDQILVAQRREAVGQLAGGIAHDFNNVCSIIRGHVELLMDDRKWNDEDRRRFAAIDVAVERATGLAANLRTLSQRLPLHPEFLHVNKIVESVGILLAGLLDSDVSLELVAEADPDTVIADRSQVEQVLLNLVLNSWDSLEGFGEIKVSTSTTASDSEPARIELTVSDSGEGMSEEVRRRAFDPFFTTKPVGTGLGLPTVLAIAEGAGGSMSLVSEPGEGTDVTVWLPLAESIDSSHEEAQSPPKEPVVDPVDRLNVLVVDDEPEVRRVIAEMLTKGGYDVMTAHDAESVIAIMAGTDEPLDILVTDVRMPGVSGYELAAALAGEHPEMGVVFVSAYPEVDDPAKPEAGSRAVFLQKPFSTDGLLEAMATATLRRAGPGPTADG